MHLAKGMLSIRSRAIICKLVFQKIDYALRAITATE